MAPAGSCTGRVVSALREKKLLMWTSTTGFRNSAIVRIADRYAGKETVAAREHPTGLMMTPS
jgi:hypothetical protein